MNVQATNALARGAGTSAAGYFFPASPTSKVRACGIVKLSLEETKCRLIQESDGRAYAAVIRDRNGNGGNPWKGKVLLETIQKKGVPQQVSLREAHEQGVSNDEAERIKKKINAGEEDAVVLIAKPFQKARKTLLQIVDGINALRKRPFAEQPTSRA